VVVAYIADGTNSDSVVYGYAFRDHWMWYNGYVMDDGNYVSFIIWKDYNCITWSTINSNKLVNGQTTSFDSSTSTAVYFAIGNYPYSTSPPVYNDIWAAAYNFIPFLFSFNSAFMGDKAYTVVLSQSIKAKYYASVCAKGYFYNNQLPVGNSGGNWGQIMFLQMR
jgi:hypothetical protein